MNLFPSDPFECTDSIGHTMLLAKKEILKKTKTRNKLLFRQVRRDKKFIGMDLGEQK